MAKKVLKIGMVLISILIFLGGNNSVLAKTKSFLTCTYETEENEVAEDKISIMCVIDEKFKYKCYQESGGKEATTKSPKASIFNWTEKIEGRDIIQTYVKEERKCPDYGLMYSKRFTMHTTREDAELLNCLPMCMEAGSEKILKKINETYGDNVIIGNNDNNEEQESRGDGCAAFGAETTKIVQWIFRLIRIGVPVIIIFLTIVDFAAVVFSGEEKNFKETGKRFATRLVIGLVIIFLPMILAFVIDLSGALVPYGIDRGELFCSVI